MNDNNVVPVVSYASKFHQRNLRGLLLTVIILHMRFNRSVDYATRLYAYGPFRYRASLSASHGGPEGHILVDRAARGPRGLLR